MHGRSLTRQEPLACACNMVGPSRVTLAIFCLYISGLSSQSISFRELKQNHTRDQTPKPKRINQYYNGIPI